MMFIIFSKGLALGILITLQDLIGAQIDQVYLDYNNDPANVATLDVLMGSKKPLHSGFVLNTILAALLCLSFFFNCCTLNHVSQPQKKQKKLEHSQEAMEKQY